MEQQRSLVIRITHGFDPTNRIPGSKWLCSRLTAVVIGMQLFVSSPAYSQEWIYSMRPGDNLWNLAQEYLVSMRYWQRFLSLNKAQNPKFLPPGSRVRFPLNWLRHRPAKVIIDKVTGNVRVTPAQSQTASPAIVGGNLGPGDQVTTAAGASAVLRFADDSRLLLRPDTTIKMDDLGYYGRRGMVDSKARLQRGRVEGKVPSLQRPAPRFEIITPSASAVVRGTDFRVSNDVDPPISRAELLEGSVAVDNDNGKVLLPPETGTVVRPGQAPARARSLLKAPDLSALASRFERIQLPIGWIPRQGAVAYNVQITGVEKLPTLFVDEQVSTARVTLPDLKDGEYILKVRGVDRLGLEGLEGIHQFMLDARPEPPASIEPQFDQTVRNNKPSFRWSTLVDAASYRFQLAEDENFTALLADSLVTGKNAFELSESIEPGVYFWRLATKDGNGEVGPYGDPQKFTLRPAPSAPTSEQKLSKTELVLRWQGAGPGQTYEVELADDEDFSKALRIEQTNKPELVLPPPKQTLWFRVRIVDVDGYKGLYGAPQQIEVPEKTRWEFLMTIPLFLIFL